MLSERMWTTNRFRKCEYIGLFQDGTLQTQRPMGCKGMLESTRSVGCVLKGRARELQKDVDNQQRCWKHLAHLARVARLARAAWRRLVGLAMTARLREDQHPVTAHSEHLPASFDRLAVRWT